MTTLMRSATELHAEWAAREITVVVVPYDTPATVSDDGRSTYVESWAPGAFDASIAKRSDRIHLHRSHDWERPIGRSVAWPTDADRLVGVFRVARTRDGDEALELAAEGLYGASLEALVEHGWSTWSADRTAVRRNRGQLERVALTGVPAFAGAEVLSVRSQNSPSVAPDETAAPQVPSGSSDAAAGQGTGAEPGRLVEVRAWLDEMRQTGDNQVEVGSTATT